MNILFLCTGNSCRSQIAEGWAKHFSNGTFDIQSAGIEAHGKNPLAIQAMRDAGVDISGQESTKLNEVMLNDADVVVTVCANADELCPDLPVKIRRLHWPLSDPAKAAGTDEYVQQVFVESRDDIKNRVQQLLEGLA